MSETGLVGRASIPHECRGVTVVGNIAYVAADVGGLAVVDLKSKTSASVHMIEAGKAMGVAAGDGILCVSDYGSRVWAFDLTDPLNPAVRGTVSLPDHANGLAIGGRFAFVCAQWAGLRVVDTSSAPPVVVGAAEATKSPTNNAIDIVMSGRRAFVVGGHGKGLKIYDLSSPSQPVLLGVFGENQYFEGVSVQGDVAYLTNNRPHGNNEVWVANVATPGEPALLGICSIAGDGHCGRNFVRDGRLFVASTGTGLEVLDVSDPTRPTWLANTDAHGDVAYVVADDLYVYLATARDGLVILGNAWAGGS